MRVRFELTFADWWRGGAWPYFGLLSALDRNFPGRREVLKALFAYEGSRAVPTAAQVSGPAERHSCPSFAFPGVSRQKAPDRC